MQNTATCTSAGNIVNNKLLHKWVLNGKHVLSIKFNLCHFILTLISYGMQWRKESYKIQRVCYPFTCDQLEGQLHLSGLMLIISETCNCSTQWLPFNSEMCLICHISIAIYELSQLSFWHSRSGCLTI